MFDAIPTWVYMSLVVILIGSTAIVAVKTSGGIRKPAQLLVLTLVTVSYIFSLTFIKDTHPQLGLDLKGGVSVVLAAKGEASEENLDLAVDIIRNRVDAIGVAEPEISRQGNNIVVDLPGLKDARAAQDLIGQTAELRFRQVAQNVDDPQLQAVLQQITINEQIERGALSQSEIKELESSSSTTSSTASSSTSAPTTSGVPGRSYKQATETTTTTTQSITPISAPAEETTITLQCGGTTPTTVELTGDLTKKTPREKDIAENPIIAVDKDGRAYALCPAVLKGDIVNDAFKQVSATGDITVAVELTSEGSSQFTNLIGRPLSGQNVAIVLDSVIQSAPTISSDLANGLTDNQLQITLGETKNKNRQAEDLATVLRYGSLPVVLEQQSAQKVSPTLGTDQLRAGILAGIIGMVLVIIYMLLYYRVLAFVVITGVLLSGLTTYALVAWLGVAQGLTLTLAGAVGLIVSLGVTVDSYIVYFEKLKDEVRNGRSIRSSLDSGFKKAFHTILAADLVSLIGAVALFFLAAGSVRGFAFFLGVSTLLDLLISLCFMHPMVKIMAQNQKLVGMKFFGIAHALDNKDLTK